MKTFIKLQEFGSPEVQEFYKSYCEENDINIEDFKIRLIDTTNLPYHTLLEYMTPFGDIVTSDVIDPAPGPQLMVLDVFFGDDDTSVVFGNIVLEDCFYNDTTLYIQD